MRCNGFIALVIVLGTLTLIACSREVSGRQAKQPTFEAETTPPTTCEGTEVRPTPNLEAIIDVPDSSWCLHGGTYEEADELINMASPNVTIRNFPGEHVFINSQLKLLNTASNFKAIGSDVSPNVEGIVFNPTYGSVRVSSQCSPLESNPTGPTYCAFTTQGNHIYGDNFLFSNIEADGDNDVLDPIWFPHTQQPATPRRAPGVCFLVTDGGDNEPATDGLFENSDIHNCGELPNQDLVDPNPGEHALYISEGLRTVIRNNLIHDNGARGVQLRNKTINPLVEGNVIYDNGWGVTLDNDVTKAVVRGNVITENPKANVDTAPMYSGSNNRVVDNCVWQPEGDSGLGNIDPSVVVSGNVTADACYDPFPTVTNPKCLDKYTGTLAR